MFQSYHQNMDKGHRSGFLPIYSRTQFPRRPQSPTEVQGNNNGTLGSGPTKHKINKEIKTHKEVAEFDEDLNPEEETTTTNTAFASVIELDDQTNGKSYSDLTGRFPAKSEAGNLYVLVLYTYRAAVTPISSKCTQNYSRAQQKDPSSRCTGWIMKPPRQ
jgi:hypothetical protein